MTNNMVNIYTYEDILGYQSIESLLGSKDACIILYQIQENYGHWILLMKHINHIEFFDPYAFKPDEELKLSTYNLKMHRGKMIPYLSLLLSKVPYPVHYNKVQLQKYKKNVNDCGRHCVVRYIYRNMEISDYVLFIGKNNMGDADFCVSAITLLL